MSALFELEDFDLAPTMPVWTPDMFACGIHRLHHEGDMHAATCWGGTCPSCGDVVRGGWDADLNHHGADWGECTSLVLRVTHLTNALRHGTEPHARDLTVLATGWRFAPDGHPFPGTRPGPILGHPIWGVLESCQVSPDTVSTLGAGGVE